MLSPAAHFLKQFLKDLRSGLKDRAHKRALPCFHINALLARNPLKDILYLGVLFDLRLEGEVFFTPSSLRARSLRRSPMERNSAVRR